MGTARAARKEKRIEKPINKFKTKKPLIDKKEQNRLVLDNEGLVIIIARRYRSIGRKFGLSFEDLKQDCNEGFTIAAQRWDPKRGAKFSTYAGIWARKCILEDLSNKNPLYLPRGVRERVKALKEALVVIKEDGDPSKLGKTARREYDEVMKGDETEENAEKRIEILEGRIIRATQTNISLDQPMGEGDRLPHEFLIGSGETASGEAESKNIRKLLLEAIDTLSNRERIIIENRFLVPEPLTLKEIGKMMGLSRERVRQKELVALRKLTLQLKILKEEERNIEKSIEIEPKPKAKELSSIEPKPDNRKPEKRLPPPTEEQAIKKELEMLSGFKTVEKKKLVYLENEGVPGYVIESLDIERIELEKLILFVSIAKKHNAFEHLRTNHILNNTTSAGFEDFIKWKVEQTAQRTA